MALNGVNYTNSTFMSDTITIPASPPALQVSLLVLQAMEGVLTLVVNAVTLMTLVRIPSLRTQTSKFIMNLSVADLVSCLLPVFSIIRYNLQPESTPWSYICCLEKLFLMLCLLGNMTFVLSVSIDRYIFMAYPLRYEVLVTPTRVCAIVMGIWVIIVMQTLITSVLTQLESTVECHYSGLLVWGTFYCVVVADFCVCFLFSLGVLTKYLLMSWKQSRQTSAWMGSVAVAGDESKEMTNMMIGVVFIHGACFSPSFIIGALLAWPSPELLIADPITTTTLLINSWIKPFIYYQRNQLYHAAYAENVKDMFKGYFEIRPMPPRVVAVPP